MDYNEVSITDSPRNPFDEMEQKAARLGAMENTAANIFNKFSKNNLINFDNSTSNENENLLTNLEKLDISVSINDSYDLNATIIQLVDDDDDDDDEDDLKSLQFKCPEITVTEPDCDNLETNEISPNRKKECVMRLNEIKQKSLEESKLAKINNIHSSIENFIKDYNIDSTEAQKYMIPLIKILSGEKLVENSILQIPTVVRQDTFDIKASETKTEGFTDATPSKPVNPQIQARRLSHSLRVEKRRSFTAPLSLTPSITKRRVSFNPHTSSSKENISPTKSVPRRSLYLTPNRMKLNITHQQMEEKTFLPSPHVAVKSNIRIRSRSSISYSENSNTGPIKATSSMRPPASTLPLPKSKYSTTHKPPDSSKHLLTPTQATTVKPLTPRAIPSRIKVIGTSFPNAK